jgi:hypothetical protein
MNKAWAGEYLRSASTRYGCAVGALMYLSYGAAYGAWANLGLIALCSFIGAFIPFYSRLSNRLEETIQFSAAAVTPGRLGRFGAQLVFNGLIFEAFRAFSIVPESNLARLGGVLGVAALTTGASQGIQYLAIVLSNREIGEKNRNVLLGLSANVVVTALATIGLTWAVAVFRLLGFGFGSLVLGMGIASDLRARFAPRGGVGVFFGTFNPFHKTHLKIINDAIRERGLEKVYIHSTVVPKLHADALADGAIRIARYEDGMRVYEKTDRADVHMNYFPTGSRFYEFSTRKLLMELAVREAGLEDKVVVLSLPEVYALNGFYGVLGEIRRLEPTARLHGVHGSDLGGMWVRGIYDESGWIYPYSVKRVDGVSATAIRKGALGMASPVVEDVIRDLRAGATSISVGSDVYAVKEGVIEYANA